MGMRLSGYLLIGAALILAGAAIYLSNPKSQVALVFTPTQVLGGSWENYKKEYLETGTGRTIDRTQNNITTSEGESYTMLRAVWEGDKATFDQSWTWTKDNLKRPNDRLSAWLFGQLPDGSYGVLTAQGGENDASDADTDLAMSLLFAYARWQDPTYLGDARVIIHDLWAQDVVTIDGTPYMTADNVEKTSNSPVALIDVSYLSPAAYRMFAQIDPTDPWQSLVDSSYQIIGQSMQAPLDKQTSAGLPPDWVAINKTTGALSAPTTAGQDTNFGYDALRTPFRLALDYQWYQDPRDLQLLQQMSFLSTEWQKSGSLASIYGHDGSVVDQTEDASMYGGTIGYFMVADPTDAAAVYTNKLQYLWDPDIDRWKQILPYYDDNWAWFGIALYNHLLPNLFTSLPAQLYEQ
jgi:endo-1,4-beta-D-glucanase Y